MMRQDPERPGPGARPPRPRLRADPATELSPAATALFERLRAWRAATAKEQAVPAYVIFHDATLREIATGCPATLADLARISGVGENKLAKYGQQILEILAA